MLGVLAVGSVKGFALTLGITVVIDVLVVVLFTHPMMQLIATTRFFSSGHPLSGLDPDALGAVYRGRAEFRVSTEARRAGAEPRGGASSDDRRAQGRRARGRDRRRGEGREPAEKAWRIRQRIESEVRLDEEGQALMASGLTKFGNDLYTGAAQRSLRRRCAASG